MISVRLLQIRRASAEVATHIQQPRRKSSRQHHHHHDHARIPQEGRSASWFSCKNEELLQTLCHRGQLHMAISVLSRMDTSPSHNTYMSLLKACSKIKALAHAKQVHAHLAVHRPHLTGLLGDYLVVTLAKCGAVEDAIRISHALPCRTVFSWTAIISAYADTGHGCKALEMHQCMQEDGVEPDSYTFASLFKACGSIPDLEQGKKLHADARTKDFTSDIFVGNTLVSMYGKCGAVREAEDVFSALSKRDTVSWNAMLSAYVEQGQGENALQLYRQMQEEGTSSDPHTLMFVLQACRLLAEKEEVLPRDREEGSTKAKPLEIGQALHADACKKGLAKDVFVGNTLVSMYGKCGAIKEAENVLSMLSQRDVVSWTAMLSACVEKDQGEKALHLYRQMQEEGVSPDQLTIVIALQACAILAEKQEALAVKGGSIKVISLEVGKALHADTRRKGFASDVFVGNTLVSMYGKSRAVVEAEEVFNELSQRDIVSWSAMLSAYVEDGHGDKALWLYRQMQDQHITLNDVTFVCILRACCETGSFEVCKQLHFHLVSVRYEQVPSVVATLIHTYGSCANTVDAQALFDDLSEPDIVSWTACIAGHAEEGNSTASLHMLEKLKLAGIKPDEVMFASALSACNHSGLIATALDNFESMTQDYGITPNMKHYGIMIDLLGRAGDLKRVENMLGQMPMQADLSIWLGLLGACGRHANLKLAKQAFSNALNLQPKDVTAYILMSNIYANAGLQECAAEVDNSRQIVCLEETWADWMECELAHSFVLL